MMIMMMMMMMMLIKIEITKMKCSLRRRDLGHVTFLMPLLGHLETLPRIVWSTLERVSMDTGSLIYSQTFKVTRDHALSQL